MAAPVFVRPGRQPVKQLVGKGAVYGISMVDEGLVSEVRDIRIPRCRSYTYIRGAYRSTIDMGRLCSQGKTSMIDTRLPGDLRADGFAFVEAVVDAPGFRCLPRCAVPSLTLACEN